MSYHINGWNYVVDGEKYLYNRLTNLYLRRLDGGVIEDVLAGYSAEFFCWNIGDDSISSPDGSVVLQLQPAPSPGFTPAPAPEPEPEVAAPASEPEPEVAAPASEPVPEVVAPAPEPVPEVVAPAPEPVPEVATQ